MKILWLINIPLPEASLLMKDEQIPFGGWLVNTSQELIKEDGVELSIAFPKKGISKYKKIIGSRVHYYAFEPVKKSRISNLEFEEIINEVKPDIVHIFGTELAHTLSMVNICKKKDQKFVISIQGLVSIISKHIFSNLPWKVCYGATLRNLLRIDNVAGLKKLFFKRGKNEIEAIERADHVIGRTTWDRACAKQINPDVEYHFCNEILREEFYKHKWDISKCEEYTIFVSQAHYPIKGLHYVLEAMPLILKRFPKAKLYISGKDITKSDSLKDKVLMTYYGKYIKGLIRDLNLENSVEFTGLLDEKKMCKRFLKTNVFVSASTIENESNSLSEAKILGVPSVASYVGGVVDRVEHNKDGFTYQHDAPYMLAHFVCEIFANKELALNFSENARKNALKVHDKKNNTNNLLGIYKKIIHD